MNQPEGSTNVQSFVKTSTIIHLAMTAGLLVFTLFSVYSIGGLGSFSFTQEPLEIGIPVLLILAISAGTFLSKIMSPQSATAPSLGQKLGRYQTAHLIKIAPVEGIGLFAAVFFQSTANTLFLMVAGVALSVLLLSIPSISKIQTAVNPTLEEQAYFSNPEKELE